MSAQVKLTAAQRREVRSLVDDEGYTRKEAIAYVLAFPASKDGGK